MAQNTPGKSCPLSAHIRKTNPRVDDNDKLKSRIVRNGIPYGLELRQDPNGKRGLLFACYQSDIEDGGFRFIQMKWLNDPNFPSSNAGFDLFTSQPGLRQDQSRESMRITLLKSNNKDTLEYPFPKDVRPLVTMKGGEYFFVPSLTALSKDLGIE